MAAISKRDGKYRVRYVDAKGAERQKTFTLKKDAEAHRQKVERELHAGLHTPDAPLFRDLARLYLDDCERRWKLRDRMAGATYDLACRLISGHLIPAFGAVKTSEITAPMVRDFVNGKADKYARITVSKLVNHLRDVLQFGVETGVLVRNIVRDQPPRIPAPPSKQIEIPTLEQLRRLVELTEGREHRHRHRLDGPAMVRVMVYAALTGGLRRGEIAGLRWENVDFAVGVVRVRHSMSRYDGLKEPKTAAGVRDVPMSPPLRSALEELRARQHNPTTGPVIRTRGGEHMAAQDLAQKHWEPLAREAGVVKSDGEVFGLHTLRHGAASLWIMQGMPALALKRVVGHSSVTTTMDVYGHLFPEDETAKRIVTATAAGLASPLPSLPAAA